jgi:hypothetical protein
MNDIRKIIDGGGALSEAQIIQVFNWVGEQGDIILLKHDGVREQYKFTVVIMSPTEKFRSIRLDGMELNVTLSKVLKEYFDR